jgi:antitoxin ParD1/3/4
MIGIGFLGHNSSRKMPIRNVSLTDELEQFVLAKVSSGEYEDASDVVRAALRGLERQEQYRNAKLQALQAAIDQGDSSGLAPAGVFSRARKRAGLNTRRR